MMLLNLIPNQLKLYILLGVLALAMLLRLRANIAADAVQRVVTEMEDADQDRASAIRRAAAHAGRVQQPDDQRGYRD